MNVFLFQKAISNLFFLFLKILKDLRFAIFILFLIAFISSLGSIIEQGQEQSFYELTYPPEKALYGFLTGKIIFFFQLDHLYESWYFNFLLIILVLSLSLCSFFNQWPLLKSSRKFFFNIKLKNFQNKKEFLKNQSSIFEQESLLIKSQKLNFYVYQNKDYIYGYKALIGRISPIIVHLSLILLLLGSLFSAFENFRAEEILAKGELGHFQNLLKLGKVTTLPNLNIRVNDFWTTYQNQKIKQFYSNISLVNNNGKEEISKTISVNQPLMKKNLNLYQSDWDFKGIRLVDKNKKILMEYPLFPLSKKEKIYISWLNFNKPNQNKKEYILIFDQLRNTFFIYNEKAKFIREEEINNSIDQNLKIVDLIKRTGLLIKYDPNIPIIYFSFGLLILSTFLSFLPYERLCIFPYKKRKVFISFSSNRNTFNKNIFAFFIEKSQKSLLKPNQ